MAQDRLADLGCLGEDTSAASASAAALIAAFLPGRRLAAARGAELITPPIEHEHEIRCYMRDPDGHLIEVGQTKR